jgi:hypothetical protein
MPDEAKRIQEAINDEMPLGNTNSPVISIRGMAELPAGKPPNAAILQKNSMKPKELLPDKGLRISAQFTVSQGEGQIIAGKSVGPGCNQTGRVC